MYYRDTNLMNTLPEGILRPQPLCLEVISSLVDSIVDSLAQRGRRADLGRGALRVVVTVSVPGVRHYSAVRDPSSFLVEANVSGLVGESMALLIHI